MEESERPHKKLKAAHESRNENGNFANPLDEIDASEVTLPSSSISTSKRNETKDRPATDEDAGHTTSQDNSTATPLKERSDVRASAFSDLSKTALKKLRKKQEWEAGRQDRKAIRKERRKDKQARKREQHEAEVSIRVESKNGDEALPAETKSISKKRLKNVQLPITFIFDSDFDQYMLDKEIISITSQLTRSYSDNKNAEYRAYLAVSSFNGRVRHRLETTLSNHHKNWKGVRFFDESFIAVSEKARVWMKDDPRARLEGAFASSLDAGTVELEDTSAADDVVYLTSDSPYTLTHLTPYTTYIIGAIVDKNRHKGLCYKRARDHNIRTAKLPIGEYLKMNSRQVLTVNQVNEIMLRWLECGDWKDAFLKVIPKRKGGELRDHEDESLELGQDDLHDEVGHLVDR